MKTNQAKQKINNIVIYPSIDINLFSRYLITLLFGFFLSNIIITIPSQTSDWSIVAASIIITLIEIINHIIYNLLHQNKNKMIVQIINSIKIGVIYGIVLDAFKLGS
uniref:Uncharacterized protein ycf20 n=1 Tax=Corynoplastis japonica TaxID=700918 RepID=A0A1X9PU28_9RHOD|nr:conserved hypothetical plastid protein [Corynoplastis japonica]